MHLIARLSIFLVTVGLVSSSVLAQQAPGGPQLPDIRGQVMPPGNITGFLSYGQTVTNLDSAVAFYVDALKYELVGTSTGRPQADTNVNRLYNTPNAQYRSANLRIPDTPWVLHLKEFTGIDRKPAPQPLRSTDPGVGDLNLVTTDFIDMWNRMMAAGGKTLSWGAKPHNRGVGWVAFVNDNQGCVLEMRSINNQAPVNQHTAVLAATSFNNVKKAAFYRDVLGFTSMQDGRPQTGPGVMGILGFVGGPDMTGADQSKLFFVQSQGNVPGSSVRFEFYQYDGLAQNPYRPRIQDACATVFQVYVHDVDEMAKVARNANAEILTADGQPVMVDGARRLVIKDPDGLYLEMIERR